MGMSSSNSKQQNSQVFLDLSLYFSDFRKEGHRLRQACLLLMHGRCASKERA
jgi:hypothetical protein